MRNTHTFTYIFVIALSFLFTSCNKDCLEGTGSIVRKTIEVDNFTELQLSDHIQVNITQGNSQLVEVEGQENLISLLNTEVNNDRWDIILSKCVVTAQSLIVHVTTPKLTEIELNGSGTIESTNRLRGELLNLRLNGSGDMNLELQTKEMQTELNGSGNINIKGSTKQHDIVLEGSGDIMAENLKSDVVSIKVDGSGDVRVNVSYEIDVDVNGSGDVYYKGQVKSIQSDIDGSGNLHQLRKD